MKVFVTMLIPFEVIASLLKIKPARVPYLLSDHASRPLLQLLWLGVGIAEVAAWFSVVQCCVPLFVASEV